MKICNFQPTDQVSNNLLNLLKNSSSINKAKFNEIEIHLLQMVEF
jgi:hypothetical protein